MSIRVHPWFVFRLLRTHLLRLHHDTRGAISVLALLTIWCLVAILGLVWNTTEEARRRAQIQTAADAAAHAASTWVARTLNSVDAQNMVISQDASTETIWRAIPPTDQALQTHLTQELAAAAQMKNNQNLQQLIRRLQTQLLNIATERTLTLDALAILQTDPGAGFASPNERTTYLNNYRQANSVLNWVYNTYVQGNAPPAGAAGSSPRPGPPGPNGEGLAQIVQKWQPPNNETQILDYIINFINTTELPIVKAFETRTAPATSQAVDSLMAQHEAQVYQRELAMTAALPVTIELQRTDLLSFYKTDITLAVVNRDPSSSGSAVVNAPLMSASAALPVTGYTDSIRTAFPQEAQQANLSPVIDIDPMNVHTDAAIIWHPNLPVAVPADIRAQFPTLRPSYTVNASFPDGWGHIWAMPLEHYVHQRVNADMQDLNQSYMVPLDLSRTQTLAQAIRQMLGIPNGNINITDLPGQLPDDQPEPYFPPILPPGTPLPPPPPPRFDQINVMPALTVPPAATAAYRAQVALYNQHAGAYTAAVRGLRSNIIGYTAFFNRFTQAFAQDTWQNNVNIRCVQVLKNLGQSKQFMVLSTYGLRPIPEWAQPGMFDNAAITIENQIMLINISTIAQAVVRDLQNADPLGLGAGILDATFRNSVTYNGYIGQATQVADAIVRPAAHDIALRIAAEWVRRPWPYEITPPAVPVPPFRGIGPDERKRLFTVLAAARQTDATAPKILLPKIFGADNSKIVAYAQAEAFNWMEFNSDYGGGERFDEVVFIPEVVYTVVGRDSRFHGFVGAPRGWRIDSLGGWQWRARLSLSDALYDALQNNQELRQYLNDAGISTPSSGALDEINLH